MSSQNRHFTLVLIEEQTDLIPLLSDDAEGLEHGFWVTSDSTVVQVPDVELVSDGRDDGVKCERKKGWADRIPLLDSPLTEGAGPERRDGTWRSTPPK